MSSTEAYTKLGELARQYGPAIALGTAVIWALWLQNETYRDLREVDLKATREEVSKERDYIRNTLQGVVERNTEAFHELKDELVRGRQ